MPKTIFLPKNFSALAVEGLAKKLLTYTATDDEAQTFHTIMDTSFTKRRLSDQEMSAWNKATEQLELAKTRRAQANKQDPGRVYEPNQNNRFHGNDYNGPSEL